MERANWAAYDEFVAGIAPADPDDAALVTPDG